MQEEKLLQRFVTWWLNHSSGDVCPENFGLKNHCEAKTCLQCKQLALAEAKRKIETNVKKAAVL